ncbi:MFS family permease [Kineococcus radiotolerans]|uniref:MFS family permease n=1 Tax=Kineococcus radiotolerans TaxID=131568 RepID=A0A7W4TQ34_KINRA|nr:MFS transporter [Kineococcus radiotolerans]MBB2903007.1 MFS family permease [Kineococcus radiotolerans]
MRSGRFVDTRPLRVSPAFRRLWIGSTAAGLSGQLAATAVLHQVWELTGSPWWTGTIGLATAVPTVVGGLVGGTLADAVDRRRLVLVTTAATVVAAAGLAAQAGSGTGSVLLVLALVVLQTTATALGAPARRTFTTRLLPTDLVPAGVALNHVGFQIAVLAGPALAGVLLATGGLRAAYLVDVLGLTVSLHGVLRLPGPGTASPPRHPARRTPAGLRATGEGWRYLLSRPELRGGLAADLAATGLAMPVALFPAVNDERFGGGEHTFGLLASAVAAGGLLAGAASGTITRVPRAGRLLLVASATWGAALAAFALVDSLPATLLCLAAAGAADTVAVVCRGTLVQVSTPDAYLGRVSAAENVVGVAGPGLGNARAGAVAGLTSATTSALTGGLACVVVVGVIAATTPALRRWRAPTAVTPTSAATPTGRVRGPVPHRGRGRPRRRPRR